jgi:hypothetical protein
VTTPLREHPPHERPHSPWPVLSGPHENRGLSQLRLGHAGVVESCPYCDGPLWEQSPEHVFPRSIGGNGLVISVHQACNYRANSSIDNPLVRCAHVRAARAAAGIASHRTGAAYEETLAGETVLMVRPPEGTEYDLRDQDRLVELFRSSEPYGVPGTRVQIGRRGDELTTRLLPNPIRFPDGVLDVFTTDDDRGGEAERVDPYTVLVLVAALRVCSHPVDAWRRFTAKVGIATIHVLARSDLVLEDGFCVREVLSATGFRHLGAALREIAFGAHTNGVTASEPFATEENARPMPTHRAGLADDSGNAVVAVRLFDLLNYRISVPDVQVRHPVQISIDLAGALADDRSR